MRRFAIIFLILLLAAAGFGVWFRHELAAPYKGYAPPKLLVDLPRGMSRREIAALLGRSGVVRSAFVFELYSRWHRRQELEAGEYVFDRPMTPREVFAMLAAGRIYVHTVKVPEGWTAIEIADELEREGLCRRDEFLEAANDPSSMDDLAPGAPSLEGFLFPATYQFTRHTGAAEIAAAMVRRFRVEWASLPGIGHDTEGNITGLPAGMTVEQVVTLASLVERETPRADERPIVAGVFMNRLLRRLPLQCDPTVQYALALEGRPVKILSGADLSFDSPYNTYRHAGLPPGPIGNPGEASLRAALRPLRVPYFYFVADAEGGHRFSRTLAEHNRNVVRYRRELRQQNGAPPDDPPRRKPCIARHKGKRHS
jgi:peptidoglycan lytic transglycosylase G